MRRYLSVFFAGLLLALGIARADMLDGPGRLVAAAICGGRVIASSYCPSRIVLTQNTNYWVRLDGNDSNSGTADTPSLAWLTLQNAANWIQAHLDLAGFTAQVNTDCASPPCTFTAGVQMLAPFHGGGSVIFNGNTGTPTNMIISVNGAAAFQATNTGTIYSVQGFELTNSNSGGSGLYASSLGSIYITGAMNFGSVGSSSGAQIWSNTGSIVNTASAWTVSGGGAYHMHATYGAHIENVAAVTVTVSGTPTFTNTVLNDHVSQMSVASMTYSGACNGQRYAIINNSDTETGGGGANYFCGSTAGGVATGGIYN